MDKDSQRIRLYLRENRHLYECSVFQKQASLYRSFINFKGVEISVFANLCESEGLIPMRYTHANNTINAFCEN